MYQFIKRAILPLAVLGLTACDPVSAPSSGTSAGVHSGGFPSGTRASKYSGSRAGVR